MASRATAATASRPEPGQILVVIHDFLARSSDELSLSRGDRVELVERDDEFGDGWYLGKHLVNGNSGLFPEVYTRLAPRGTPILPSYSSAPRSLPTSPPLNGGANPSIAAVPSSAFSTAGIHNPPGSDSGTLVATSESSNSVPAPEMQKSSRASRHVSASQVHDVAKSASSLNENVPPNDLPSMPTITTSTASSPPKHPALSAAANTHANGQDSPVMNETLSVIQEHISNMATTQRSGSADRRGANDSGSEYSSHLDQRMSYIHGEETDEEEIVHNRAEVNGWTPDQVAEYLFSAGVEARHCEVFREQEITGDVLLAMEQTSVFLKEFELGSVGRRLKTWQRIKALQDEVKRGTPSGTRRSTQNYGSDVGSEDSSRIRSQTRTSTTVLPRIPSVNERPGSRPDSRPESHQTARYSQQHGAKANTMQAVTPMSPISPGSVSPAKDRSSTMPDHARRPSAASIRDLHHSRRHSSNDYGPTLFANGLASGTNSPTTNPLGVHKKGPSFDRGWTMGSQSPASSLRPASSSGKVGLAGTDEEDQLSRVTVTTPWEFDRGYFSGGDIDGGRQRNVLRKRGTPTHSRSSSYTDEQRTRSATTNARHSRFGSVDSIRDPHMSPASQKYYGVSLRHRTPSSTSVGPQPPPKDAPSPTVTKLDGNMVPPSPTDLPVYSEKPQTPDWQQAGNGITSPRGLGLRATSNAVTESEKSRIVLLSEQASSPLKDESLQSPSHTGSTTSGGPSFELDSPSSSKPLGTIMAPAGKTTRKKSKKETSAYTRGLETKTPKEQMSNCDYSGWMKKKSTNLMTTWKPRLFILKGRRLSYYYSEDDEQEQGLIDISFHRVLPADNDRLTGLHATLTGATTSPTSPSGAVTETLNSKEAAAEPQSSLSKGTGDQMFIFKLVPPRAGLSRAVTFTKPTVYYFAVPNLTQGRLWMAALMKATIDRDDTKPITTTYQQKTISLAKARAMRHRPPALMNLDEKAEEEPPKTPQPDLSGLNIRGIIFDKETNEGDSGVSGVSKADGVPLKKTTSDHSSNLGSPVTMQC